MHWANAEKSQRLKLILAALQKAGRHGMTGGDVARVRGSLSVATDISELRAQGYPIPPAEYLYQTASGSKVYLYRWGTS